MGQGHTPPKYGQVWQLSTLKENAAQMMTVSELFIYRTMNKESLRFLCYFAGLCIMFSYFVTKNRICTANTS